MGGSGGNYFSGGDPEKTQEQLQISKDETQDAEYVAQCNGYLGALLANYNDRDVEAIDRHLAEILAALGKRLSGSVELKFGGSVAKHTFVDGISDVDSLIMLDSCELAEKAPAEARRELASILRERFPNVTVTEGKLAVTLSFGDVEIQLLPAVSCRKDVKIGDSTGESWATIRPTEFTNALTDSNGKLGGKLVPTIKLAKGLISGLPEQQQISGYHLEALAIESFKGYKGSNIPRDMLRHFFARASTLVLAPIEDRTGQSVHVDDRLGSTSSLERKIVSGAFARLARRMANADSARRIDDWKSLFGET